MISSLLPALDPRVVTLPQRVVYSQAASDLEVLIFLGLLASLPLLPQGLLPVRDYHLAGRCVDISQGSTAEAAVVLWWHSEA